MPVLTVVEADRLIDVWQILNQTGDEHVVVVDEQQHPIGILRLQRLIRLTLPENMLLGTANPDEAPARFVGSIDGIDGTGLQQSIRQLNQWAVRQGQPLLDPVMTLPVQRSLDQIQSYLPDLGNYDWVLVDAIDRCMGLLDRLRLLQFLALNPIAHPDSTPEWGQPPPNSSKDSGSPSRPEQPPVTIDPLIDLLERLPIPLMLQTTTGRIITQNLVWRQQVGELRDPAQIWQEAALILESTFHEAQVTVAASNHPPAITDRSIPSELSTTHPLINLYAGSNASSPASEPIYHAGACRLSADSNACVCVCPMKNGQDRVWQFIKIPMGTVASQSNAPAPVESTASSFSQFKLAALGFSPDPGWRSLVQTENLWLVLAQDMTEQQQVARELAAKNADLVQLNRLKDEFLACISHELKTPLTAVLGLSSLLKDHSLGALNERQSRYAQLIYQSGRHLILIVNDILDLTRIETGQLDLSLEPVCIETICSRAYRQARQLQPSDTASDVSSETLAGRPDAEVPFQIKIQPGLETIVADELRLRQMLTNLLSNALKFTEVGGELGLKVEVWDGWIAFTVWDTGIGIPTEKQHLIFQKFQQLENPLTRRFEGTGLGLVLTQRLARLHGGDVTFTSVEGRGSQFTLLLPAIPPQASTELGGEDSRTTSAPSISSDNRMVLVVQAAPRLIEELTNQLVGLGYRVAIARSGTEALEKIRRLRPGVVFLNPLLPALSGWDVLTLLKADDEARHIPIVITATRAEKEQAYQNGADGFLNLPIQAKSLQHCLDSLNSATVDKSQAVLANLTVLYLHDSNQSLSSESIEHPLAHDLNSLLHPHSCRVLEVDDLEQADLVARVWKPDVVLLDGTLPDPSAYIQQLSQHSFLAALPLVTLTAELTQAANQIPELVVYPCLTPMTLPSESADSHPKISALLQVIQVAAGISWTPHVLIVDLATLAQNWSLVNADSMEAIAPSKTQSQPANTLRALVQYIQISGFRSSISNIWDEIAQQLQHQSIDLLLFCTHALEPQPLFFEIIQTLEQLEVPPPVLVWNYQAHSTELSNADLKKFEALWGTVAVKVLPASLSTPKLLAEIDRVLSTSTRG